MNRNDEFKQLLDEVHSLDNSIKDTDDLIFHARKKYNRHRYLIKPLKGLACTFACFVLLVNFCTPVAYACSKLPVLKELAEAVSFSRSLSDAVDNEYYQPINLEQTDNSVTAIVSYLIVDQKQVNVFYSLNSDKYNNMSADPSIKNADGSVLEGYSISSNYFEEKNGELRSLTIDFIDGDVPECLSLMLNITDNGSYTYSEPVEESVEDSLLSEVHEYNPDYIAKFDFKLHFDSKLTAKGKTIAIDKTIDVGGQKIKLTDMEIYPTHLRLNVSDYPDNAAWIKSLDFYVETDWGMKFDIISNGITATGSIDSPMMQSYRADSTYFYDAKHIKIVVTGASLLEKDMEKIHINLTDGIADKMPQDTELYEIKHTGNSWRISIKAKKRKENALHQIFLNSYFDENGKQYDITSWSSCNFNDSIEYFTEEFALVNYPFDEVWLSPVYSSEWTADTPIEIPIK